MDVPSSPCDLPTLSRIKSGRKKKHQTSRYLPSPLNPYHRLHQRLLQYLEEIGLLHGLCFTPELRRHLRLYNRVVGLQWGEEAKGWEYQEEVGRVRGNAKLIYEVRKVVRSIRRRTKLLSAKNDQSGKVDRLRKWSISKIIDLVIRPGQIVDPQCRNQLYFLNLKVIQSIFWFQWRQFPQRQQILTSIFDKLCFLNRTFTTYKKKNWIENKKCTKEQMIDKFAEMFNFFRKCYKPIVYQYEGWHEFNEDIKNLFDQTQQIKEEKQNKK